MPQTTSIIPPCFKAYDIRGRVPDQLNPQLARDIGRAYAAVCAPRKVAVGHDIRLSSAALTEALITGLLDSGVDVLELGCAAPRRSTTPPSAWRRKGWMAALWSRPAIIRPITTA